jgi:peptide deformylase
MILPIVVYGYPVLKQKTAEISNDFENLEELIKNMWQTMYSCSRYWFGCPTN